MLKTKDTIKYWKAKAWHEFSLYTRLQGADGGYEAGTNTCCTCDTTYPVKRLQAGHFVPGRHSIILFDERNCHPQCYNCNINLKGAPRKYESFMKSKYGQEVIDELDRLDGQQSGFKWFDYKELFEKYKALNMGE